VDSSRPILGLTSVSTKSRHLQYHTETKVDPVNRALREVAERRARRLRKASAVWDRMADDMAETDWDEAWRRSS